MRKTCFLYIFMTFIFRYHFLFLPLLCGGGGWGGSNKHCLLPFFFKQKIRNWAMLFDEIFIELSDTGILS